MTIKEYAFAFLKVTESSRKCFSKYCTVRSAVNCCFICVVIIFWIQFVYCNNHSSAFNVRNSKPHTIHDQTEAIAHRKFHLCLAIPSQLLLNKALHALLFLPHVLCAAHFIFSHLTTQLIFGRKHKPRSSSKVISCSVLLLSHLISSPSAPYSYSQHPQPVLFP